MSADLDAPGQGVQETGGLPTPVADVTSQDARVLAAVLRRLQWLVARGGGAMALDRSKASAHSGTRMRFVLIALAAIVAAGVAAGTAWRASSPTRDTSAGLADVAGPQAGRLAPAFAIPALNGGRMTLAQYGGRPRLVSFFASWCVECWNDMRVLERAYERYHRQGLVIMGVGAHDTADSLRLMTARLDITFPTGYDPSGDLVARPYHLYSIPTTVFVGADGVIKAVVQGRVHSDTLEQYLPLILPAATSAQ